MRDNIDEAARLLMEFKPEKAEVLYGHYEVFYHEDRLYSVRNTETGVISLVFASSPSMAVAVTIGNTVQVNQYGGNCKFIGHVENLKL